MQETFRDTRKCAATCRKLSGTPENLLHPCMKLSGGTKPCYEFSLNYDYSHIQFELKKRTEARSIEMKSSFYIVFIQK